MAVFHVRAVSDADLLRRIAQPVWEASRLARNGVHLRQGGFRCPTAVAPFSGGRPDGRGVPAGCEECVSLHAELLAVVVSRIRGRAEPPADMEAFARTVAANEMTDQVRRHRALVGAPSRPERPAGRLGKIYAACPAPWLRALAELVITWAGSAHPVPAGIFPADRWLQEKSRVLGVWLDPADPGAAADLGRDIDAVLAVMRQVGGMVRDQDGRQVPWVERYVLRPLGHSCRHRPSSLDLQVESELRDGAPAGPLIASVSATAVPAVPQPPDELRPATAGHRELARQVWRTALRHRATGLPADHALSTAATEILGPLAPSLLGDSSFDDLASTLDRAACPELRAS